MQSTTIETLFDRFRTLGDVDALGQVFDRSAPELSSVARHLARDQGDVDDLVQATFLAAIESADAWDPKRRLMPWLLGVLVMHVRRLRQERGRVLEPERLALPSVGTPEHALLGREVTEAVESAVADLPERYARVLRLYLGQGLAPAELARELELEPGTARVQLHRGLKLLREALPAGLAGGAAIATTGRGLTAVRRVVMTEARSVAGPSAVAVTSAGALGWLVPLTLGKVTTLGLVAATLIAVPWALWPEGEQREPVGAVAGVSPAPQPQPELEPVSGQEPATEPGPRVALARELEEAAKPDLRARIRGRFLLPGGAPAAGVALTLTTRMGDAPGSREPRPADPDPIQSASADDGSFELAFDASEQAQLTLRAEPMHHAVLRWEWFGLEAEFETDLGDVLLTGIGALEARIVDRTGRILADGWRVQTSRVWAETGSARRPTNTHSSPDPGSGSFRIERLPAGENSVSARHESGAVIEARWVDVPELGTAEVELLYEGAALDGTITLRVGVRNGPRPELAEGAVQLVDAGGGVRPPIPPEGLYRRSNRYVFEDLAPGSYRAEVNDPNFEQWSQDDVQPGQIIHATLQGSTGVQLTVLDDDGLPLERYALRVIYHRAAIMPNDHQLVRATEAPPPDGVVRGLQPGDLTLEVTVPDRPSARSVIEALAPGEMRPVEMRVGMALSIHGRLVGSDGLAPESDVRVEITRGERAGHDNPGSMIMSGSGEIPAILNAVQSDAQGHFRFDELAGELHTLRARWNNWLSVEQSVVVSPDAGEIVLAMPPAGWLEGALTLPAGRSATDHEFVFRYESLRDDLPSSLRSDMFGGTLRADGTFRFGPLPVGEIDVYVKAKIAGRPDPGTMQPMPLSLGKLEIQAGEVTSANFDLRAGYSAQLRVTAFVDGRPGISAGLVLKAPREGSEYPNFASGHVPASGSLFFPALTPGLYRVTLTDPDRRWAWTRPEPLALESGDQRELEVTIELHSHDVLFLDEGSDEPLVKQRVGWRMGGYISALGTTDAEGRLALGLCEGEVSFWCLNGEEDERALTWGEELEGRSPVSVEWTPGSTELVLRLPGSGR